MAEYSKYKRSGFSWIGDIPEHWEVKRTKYVAKLYNGDSLNDEQKNVFSDFSETDETIPYIASKDIDKDSCSVDYMNGTRIPKKEKNTNGRPFSMAPAGSSLLCIEGGSAGKKRCILNREVNFVNKLCCFVPKINGKFLFYYICSNSYWENFKQNLQGMIGGVTVTKLSTFPIPIPSDNEQKAIANYLDVECKKIDDLIAKEEKRVHLLQEVRLSILSKTILQGIKDGVKTVQSKYNWIGNIPEHWEVKRTKYVAKLYNGDSLNDEQKISYSDFSESDETLPYIASKDIDKDTCFVDYMNGTRIPKKEKNTNGRPFSKAPAGATLLCIEGGNAGKKRCILDREVSFVNKLCCFVPKINGKFLFYYICSNSYWEIFKQNLQGMIGGVTVTKLGTFPIPIPPESEQDAIVAFLDRECGQYDDKIAKANHQIDLLKEYKLSLITEVVTGKRKVC